MEGKKLQQAQSLKKYSQALGGYTIIWADNTSGEILIHKRSFVIEISAYHFSIHIFFGYHILA